MKSVSVPARRFRLRHGAPARSRLPAKVRPNWRVIAAAAAPAGALLIIGYFAFSALAGSNGILSFADYHRQLTKRQSELASIEAERTHLQHRAALLDPRRGADPDYVDQLVRERTGQVRQDEVILERR